MAARARTDELSDPTRSIGPVIDMRGDPATALETEAWLATQHWGTGWPTLDTATGGGLRRGATWIVRGPAEVRRPFLSALVAAANHGGTAVLQGSAVEDPDVMALRVWRRRVALITPDDAVVTDFVRVARSYVEEGTFECIGPDLVPGLRDRDELPEVVVLDDVHLEPTSTALALGASRETVDAVGPVEAMRVVARRTGRALVVGLDGPLDLDLLRRSASPADTVLDIDADDAALESRATAWVGPGGSPRRFTSPGFDWRRLHPEGPAARRSRTVRGLA